MVLDHRSRTRRQMLKGALGVAGVVLSGGRAFAAPQGQPVSEGAGIVRLSDDLFVVTIPGETNVVVHTGGGGALLVDGASARGADALMKAVASLPGSGPV